MLSRFVESPLRVEPHPFLKCGDTVRIKSGPLEGIEGILVRQTRGYRLVLSVEMLSKSAAVEVDVSAVNNIQATDSDRREKQAIVPGVSNSALHRSSFVFAGG